MMPAAAVARCTCSLSDAEECGACFCASTPMLHSVMDARCFHGWLYVVKPLSRSKQIEAL